MIPLTQMEEQEEDGHKNLTQLQYYDIIRLVKEQKGEEEVTEEKAEDEATPTTAEERTFKKRYGDLRRHTQEIEKEFGGFPSLKRTEPSLSKSKDRMWKDTKSKFTS